MSFFGISLWDQSIVGWYALLAFIGAVAVPIAQQQPALATLPQEPAEPPVELLPEKVPTMVSLTRRRLLETRGPDSGSQEEPTLPYGRRPKEV
jgi:hypothetical protein